MSKVQTTPKPDAPKPIKKKGIDPDVLRMRMRTMQNAYLTNKKKRQSK